MKARLDGRRASAIAWATAAQAPVQCGIFAWFDPKGLTPSLVAFYFAVAAYAAVAAIILRRFPRHLVGWLFCGEALVLGWTGAATAYVENSATSAPGYLAASVFASAGWIAGLGTAACFLGLIIPDGRLPSPRWRPAVWVGALVTAGLIVGTVFGEGALSTGKGQNPLGVPYADLFMRIASVAAVPILLINIAAVVVRYWRGSTVERQQLKWILAGFVVVILSNFLPSEALQFVAWSLLPVSFAVAILRYRLFEIDRIISRTLSYALLTALLVGTFAGIVLLTTRVLPFSSPVAVAASTLAAAALFNPLRTRVQRLVDRRFNRARYDRDALVAAFAAKLRDAVDSETIASELAGAATSAVEPASVSIWVRG